MYVKYNADYVFSKFLICVNLLFARVIQRSVLLISDRAIRRALFGDFIKTGWELVG